MRWQRYFPRRLLLFFTILVVAGCAGSFQPRPLEEVNFLDRVQTQSQDNIQVTAAVLSAEETEQVFGFPLYKKGIQPVWLEVENKEKEPTWFLPFGLDPDYFPPLEVTYPYHRAFQNEYNRQLDDYFRQHAMGLYIAPGATRSGFVFTNLDLGTKIFNVDLVGDDNLPRTFTFFIEVPGLVADHRTIEFEKLYTASQLVAYDENGLQKALESIPCCTTNADGTEQYLPINLVLIGDDYDLLRVLIRSGWNETAAGSKSASQQDISSDIPNGSRYQPIPPLYYYGRPQDGSFRDARSTGFGRNVLRLWLSPMRFEGQPVWIGQISRDIGVRFTTKTITTHKIDPDVDETRSFLIQDLWYSQGLEKFGYVKGVGAASYDEPRGNLTGDPYFTDGLRAILWVSSQPSAFSEVGWFDWEHPTSR
jgi:hypothetical protein